jgi:hypothetical protein
MIDDGIKPLTEIHALFLGMKKKGPGNPPFPSPNSERVPHVRTGVRG